MSKKQKVKIWSERPKPRPPSVFLTNAKKVDAETLRIQQWLDLADLALNSPEEENPPLPFKKTA